MEARQALDEFRHIGAPGWLVDLADELGVDAALTVWRRLSDEAGDDHRVSVPRWSTFLRYQRNRYILSLDAQGCSPEIIHERVRTSLRERISLPHIRRIILRQRAP